MAYKITGTILALTPTQTLTSKSGTSYQKRDLVITARKFDEYTGLPTEDSDNTPKFTFFGNQCASLDQFKVGDIVVIGFEVNGRNFLRDGVTEYFTELRPRFIDFAKKGATAPLPQTTAQAPEPQPTPGFSDNDLKQAGYAKDDSFLPF